MKSSHECRYEGCDEPTGGKHYCIEHSRKIELAKIMKEGEERKRLLKSKNERVRHERKLSKGKTYDERKREQKEFLVKLKEQSRINEFEFGLKTGVWGAICERITFLRKKKKELEDEGIDTKSICYEIDVLTDRLRE